MSDKLMSDDEWAGLSAQSRHNLSLMEKQDDELRTEIKRIRDFASGRGMVSEAADLVEVAVLVCGLHDKIDDLQKKLEWYAEAFGVNK